ncbi:hypothetical protein PLIIFM63780_010577 [Purpureocillium lilacinum]|nr:hypothetical protein PLIIFM63780_010577 [Purpureocillium lilacinum]
MPECLVLAVPAYFNMARRAAYLTIAELAGMNPKRVKFISEPVAAMISITDRNHDPKFFERGTYGVIDPGGGTFDVAAIWIEPNPDGEPVYMVQATAGDNHPRGVVFDRRALDHVRGDIYVATAAGSYQIQEA